MKSSADPRRLALQLLDRLDTSDRTLDVELDILLSSHPDLPKREKALLQTLVYGVLRWRGRLDWVIARCSQKPLRKIDPAILSILRIGVFQIQFLSRIPDSAAVNTAVQLTKEMGFPWAAGFVNGILRSTVRQSQTLRLPNFEQSPVQALAVEKSFPEWLLKRWIDRFGAKETADLCDAINEIPPITVRINALKTSVGQVMEKFAADRAAVALYRTRYSPLGLSFEKPVLPVHLLSAFKDGWFQVQDEGAQLISMLLDPKPGETVLDACCGLGGKTGHIGQIMENSGIIYALDQGRGKLARLENEMRRLGIDNVQTVCHDLDHPLDPERFPKVDRILLDAPCSGLGVLRRNPDAKWRLHPRVLRKNQDRQVRFLENTLPVLKPGGHVVYSVCSFEPEETVAVVEAFLNRHPDLRPDDAAPQNNGQADWPVKNGSLYTFPHKHGMDGFYAVRWVRD